MIAIAGFNTFSLNPLKYFLNLKLTEVKFAGTFQIFFYTISKQNSQSAESAIKLNDI